MPQSLLWGNSHGRDCEHFLTEYTHDPGCWSRVLRPGNCLQVEPKASGYNPHVREEDMIRPCFMTENGFYPNSGRCPYVLGSDHPSVL